MTDDDNTIDIIDGLPPVEVRKPWRQELPNYYIKHIDELVALRKAITAMSSRLRHTHLRQLMEAVSNDCGRDEGPTRYASAVHAVGVRLEADDRLDIIAPFGLDDLFAMVIRPNRVMDNEASYEAKAARARAIWPELVVVPWSTRSA
jgi:hypothetical protein